MLKGLYIMLIVFAVVAIFGWGMTKLGNVPDSTRRKYRKAFFIGYGVLLLAQAGVRSWEDESFGIFSLLLALCGFGFIYGGFYWKLEKAEN